MNYVEGYLVSVHPDRRESYGAFSVKIAAVNREQGALRSVDRWLDEPPQGSETSHAEGARDAPDETFQALSDFRTAASTGPDKMVMLSWTEWPDKAASDAGLVQVLADLRLQPSDDGVTFEGRHRLSSRVLMILNP